MLRAHCDCGIVGLLAEAERPDRRFDIVIRESIDRIARPAGRFSGFTGER
jgi:hypothetical protein